MIYIGRRFGESQAFFLFKLDLVQLPDVVFLFNRLIFKWFNLLIHLRDED